MERIFAVGDIHGCLDKLIELMDTVDIDPDKDTLVFIGDYIDRGTDSKGVVDYLIELAGQYRGVYLCPCRPEGQNTLCQTRRMGHALDT